MVSLTDQFTWSEIVDKTYDHVKEFIPHRIKFVEWMMTKEGVGYLFDSMMIGKCYQISRRLPKNQDFIIIIIGKEGIGKSTLAAQLCSYVDPTFGVHKIHLKAAEFIGGLRKSVVGEAHDIDEGGLDLFSREAMRAGNVRMVKVFMAAVRRKGQLVVVNIPQYNMIDSYFRSGRFHLLIDIRRPGSYIAYFGDALNKINQDFSRTKNVAAIRVPNGFFWNGNFNKSMGGLVDEEKYLVKKDAHIDEFLEGAEKELNVEPISVKLVPGKVLMKQLSISRRKLYGLLEQGKIKGSKLGQQWYFSPDEIERLCTVIGTKRGTGSDLGGGGSEE